MTSLVGSVFERKAGANSSTPARSNEARKTGFPAVQHRSKSAFARGREEQKRNGDANRPVYAPVVQPVGQTRSSVRELASSSARPDVSGEARLRATSSDADWRKQMEEDNLRRVESMTEEELEEERREIMSRFGSGVGDILRKVREARATQAEHKRKTEDAQSMHIDKAREPAKSPSPISKAIKDIDVNVLSWDNHPKSATVPSSPRSALSKPNTRPSSRADRHLRFADVTPQDVHVYESAPPSPRRKPLALMAPPEPDQRDDSIVHVGTWKGKNPLSISAPETEKVEVSEDSDELEEGTPEYIRRRFFPNTPANDPSLAWMQDDSSSGTSSSLRFDLTGTPIPADMASMLPTHLGLHHHAEGTLAGYTLDDIFLLSRSTVPAQRSTMLGVLARIARRLGKGRKKGRESEGIPELKGQEEELRRRISAAGVEAVGDRGNVAVMAIEALWECLVGWDEELVNIEGVEFSDGTKQPVDKSGDVLSSLPLDYLLSQITNAFNQGALPSETLSQLLAIVHRFAQHSNSIADTIVTTPNLLVSLIRAFLLTPIPPTETSPLPNSAALQCLITLASASRTNATALVQPSDAILRFVTALPSDSPFGPALATSLLVGTLQLYAVLGSYGLYSHIATTASEHFARLGTFVCSQECRSKSLIVAWLQLLETWTVCATDPHQTTPGHEILWSQVVAWGWGEQALCLSLKLKQVMSEDPERCCKWANVWEAVWRVESAWLEGARLNGVRNGESEIALVIEAMLEGFATGRERDIVNDALTKLELSATQLHSFQDGPVDVGILSGLRAMATQANTLSAAIRLWLACIPPTWIGPPPSPPFLLPFDGLSATSAMIVKYPGWPKILSPDIPPQVRVFFRSLTTFLAYYLRLSRRLPGTTQDLWMAQAFSILCRTLPGDEAFGQRTAEEVVKLVSESFLESKEWRVPPVLWSKGGTEIILPFLLHAFRPRDDVYIGPTWVSPYSISKTTTLRLPGALASHTAGSGDRDLGLPLTRDWLLSPLDHLLRSGSSAVFNSLPSSWDASETEVVRGTLLLARVAREVLTSHGLSDLFMSREETVFGCMKVFVLEHEQDHDNSLDEVFRDIIVSQFMDDLLAPFTLSAASPSSGIDPEVRLENLEVVATRFLEKGTPFFQYYTDFVALYDAISFSHPLFASLLLPPISMRYPLDYRKYLWGDFGHVLKTVRTPVEKVISGDIAEYFWPVEGEPEMVAWYLRALLSGTMDGFVRLFAIHHLACSIWPDLRAPEGGDERAERLLQAIVDQADVRAVREVVLYRQVRDGMQLLPPLCFEQAGEWKTLRLQFVGQVGGEAMRSRLEPLLKT